MYDNKTREELIRELMKIQGQLVDQEKLNQKIKAAIDAKNQIEKELHAINRATKAILEEKDFSKVARSIFDYCKDLIGATSGYVALLNETGDENEVLFLESGGLPCDVNPDLPMPIRGLRGEAYRSNKTVFDNDFMNSEWARFMPKGHVVLHNVMFAPLVVNGKTVGIIGLANKTSDFNENDAEIASKFGELAAIALKKAQDFSKKTLMEQEKERAYKELEASESRYKTLFNTISDAVYIHEADGRILDVNKVAYERLGYTKKEILKLFASDVDVDHPDKDTVQNEIAPAIASGPLRVESRHRTKGNAVLNVELNMNVFQEKGKDIFVTVARDITEQKRLLSNLKKGEEKLRYILDSLPDMILEVDSNMKIIWANKAALKLNNGAVGKTCYEAFPGRDNKCEGCYCAKAYKSRKIEAGVMHQKNSATAGESYWENVGIPLHNQDNGVLTVLEVSRNVTDRVKTEKERERLIEKLESALEEVKKLSGLLPICSYCKKIRDDSGYWNQIEAYLTKHSDAQFSHGICQECAKKYFPDMDIYGD